ncbi:MAG TPA: MFS transporter [Polyangiaceae bacterium]|nr:MFS transporter [Polyangiaceae bacterium]
MTSAGETAHPRAAFRHRDFRLALAGSVASVIAMQMQGVAIGWQVYDLTHRPLDLGFVGLAQFLPAIVLSLVAGQTADRFDRRGIMRVCQLAQVACALLLWIETRDGTPSVGTIYALLVLVGIARAFHAPASQALLPHLVPSEDFSNAVTWTHSVRQVASMTGPALGGILYGAAQGAGGVYTTCAGLFFAAFLMTSLVRDLRRRDDDLRNIHELLAVAHRTVRDGSCRHGERRHSPDARAAFDAGRHARAGQRREHGLHQRVERAW